jgi:hypothetical protein
MKMKKYFKFFTVTAIIAAGMVGCSSESPVNTATEDDKPTIPPVAKKETHATFQFIANQPDTKATQVDPDGSEPTTVANYRLIIFDTWSSAATREVDTVFPSTVTNMTVKMTSGDKQIYVMQSVPGTYTAPSTYTGWQLNLRNLSTTASQLFPAANSGPTFFNAYPFTINGTETQTNLLSPNIVDFKNLLYNTFVYSNRSDSANFTLQSGVTDTESQTAGNPNNIKIRLRRAVAKLHISQTPNSPTGAPPAGVTFPAKGATETITLDSTGIIVQSTLTYKILNILTVMYPFQYYVGGVLQTPFMSATGNPAVAGPLQDYEPFVARGYMNPTTDPGSTDPFFPLKDTIGIGTAPGIGGDIAVVAASSPSPVGYYIMENVAKEKRIATFGAVKAEFLPTKNKYMTSVAYNDAAKSFNPTPGTTNITTPTTFYFLKSIPAGLGAGLAIGNVAMDLNVAKKITYHLLNPTVADKGAASNYSGDATDAQVAALFAKYTNGICYYRVDIGDYTIDAAAKATGSFGVNRNHAYKININGFLQLGANRVADLIGDPGTKLKGETYLTVTVELVPWEEIGADTWI